MWKAYLDAGRIPNPNYPDLGRYHDGDALAFLVKGLTSMAVDGHVGDDDIVGLPKVVELRGRALRHRWRIKDCVDITASHLVKRDGSPYEHTPGGMRHSPLLAA